MYMSLDLFKCRCGGIECLSTREGSRASDFDTKHNVNPASPMRSKSHTHQLYCATPPSLLARRKGALLAFPFWCIVEAQ